MDIQGIVFDMDGVLFDSEPVHGLSWQAVLRARGLDMPVAFFDEWIGVPDVEFATHAHREYGLPSSSEDLLDAKRASYRQLAVEKLHPYDGLPDLLGELASRLPLAVATSSGRDDLDLLLGAMDLTKYFRATITFDDITHAKPHPEIFETAAAKLGVAPSSCVALEDSPAGVASAKAAGMYVLGIAASLPVDRLSDADEVFETTPAACRRILAQMA